MDDRAVGPHEERPCGPDADGRCQCELEEGSGAAREESGDRGARQHVTHGYGQQRCGECERHPEPPGHVGELRVVLLPGGDCTCGLEGHAADRAAPGAFPAHLGMHGAGVDHGGSGRRRRHVCGFRGPVGQHRTGCGISLWISQEPAAAVLAAEVVLASFVHRRDPVRTDFHPADGIDPSKLAGREPFHHPPPLEDIFDYRPGRGRRSTSSGRHRDEPAAVRMRTCNLGPLLR